MTRRKRRNHSSAFKAKVALSALKGDALWRSWPSSLMFTPIRSRTGRSAWSKAPRMCSAANAVEAQHNEKEVEKLHAKIGQLAMENDFLSKVLGRDR